MRTEIAIFEGFSIEMTRAEALGASTPGQRADEPVAALLKVPRIAAQLDTPSHPTRFARYCVPMARGRTTS